MLRSRSRHDQSNLTPKKRSISQRTQRYKPDRTFVRRGIAIAAALLGGWRYWAFRGTYGSDLQSTHSPSPSSTPVPAVDDRPPFEFASTPQSLPFATKAKHKDLLGSISASTDTMRWPPVVTRLPKYKGHQQVPFDRSQWPPVVTRIPVEAPVATSTYEVAWILETSSMTGVCAPIDLDSSLPLPDTHRNPIPEDEILEDTSNTETKLEQRRYLLPLRITEQESKARIHFQQLALLAQALNRTLVLPNVGKSRMGACWGMPFDTYYDARVDGAKVVSFEEFEEQMVDWSPTAQIVSISSKPAKDSFSSGNGVAFELMPNQNASLPDVSRCLPKRLPQLNLTPFDPLEVYPTTPERIKQARTKAKASALNTFGEAIVEGLVYRPENPDVLVVNYNLRYPAFIQPPPKLEYSQRLNSLAESIAPPTPYLVVHWRMEGITADALRSCAESLVELLGWLLIDEGEGIEKVWLATDYSTEGQLVSKSGTFREFGEKHREAIGVLKGAFEVGGTLRRWSLVGLGEALVGREEPLTKDSGVLGILDKIVAMRATLFVSGEKGCARASSYTKQVIEERKRGHGGVRNVVEMFG